MRRPRKTQDESESESKLRRDRRHCPVCVERLPRIAGRGRPARKCIRCGAQPQPGKRCARCYQEAIWEAKTKAACQSCANHGSKLRVIAGEVEATAAEGEA
jgi:hypothetical protein